MQIVIVCQVSQFAKMKYGGDIGAEHAQDEDGVKLPVLDPGENVFAVTNFNSKIVGTYPLGPVLIRCGGGSSIVILYIHRHLLS